MNPLEDPVRGQGGPTHLAGQLKALALAAGFSRAGIAAAHDRPDDLGHLHEWLNAGMHGEMAWLERDPARRCDPRQWLPGARSVVVLALDYDTARPRSVDSGARAVDSGARAVDSGARAGAHGWISRYAWGRDYHKVAEARLKALTRAVTADIGPTLGDDFRGADAAPGPFDPRRDFRWEVDYGPVLERPWAQEAGLGWQGRHSLLVDPNRGSFFFLAVVVTTLELAPDPPQVDHCGSCRACVDACPTGAIVADRVVDARRCISYRTIELKRPLANEESTALAGNVFGCDICQDVCPFNRFSAPSGEPDFEPRPGNFAPRLAELVDLDETAFRDRFAGSPLMRRGFEGVRANARAVAQAAAQTGEAAESATAATQAADAKRAAAEAKRAAAEAKRAAGRG